MDDQWDATVKGIRDAIVRRRGEASKPGDVHVMPNFGREHAGSSECWCRPKADPRTLDRQVYAHTLWIHEVEQ